VRGQRGDAVDLDLMPPSEELVLPAGVPAAAPPDPQLVRALEDGRPARLDDRGAARSTRSGITVRSPDVGPRDEAAARSAGTGR
jgi:hypothetical protein